MFASRCWAGVRRELPDGLFDLLYSGSSPCHSFASQISQTLINCSGDSNCLKILLVDLRERIGTFFRIRMSAQSSSALRTSGKSHPSGRFQSSASKLLSSVFNLRSSIFKELGLLWVSFWVLLWDMLWVLFWVLAGLPPQTPLSRFRSVISIIFVKRACVTLPFSMTNLS